MTAIIAVYDSEVGAMAADSQMTGAYCGGAQPKIHCYPDLLVGSAGSLLADIFLRDCDPALLCAGKLPEFAEAWREWCQDRGHNESHQGMTIYPAHFLFLTPMGIWEMDSTAEVFQHRDDTVAIGAGVVACMAAAHALHATPFFDPSCIARAAVKAAIDLVEGCGGHVQVETLKIK